MASFYSYAVSQVIDILDVNRSLNSIEEKVSNFVNKNNFTEEQKKDLAYKIIYMGQDKFNKLVVPYLKMEPIDMSKNIQIPNPSLFRDITGSIPFYLHDLVHEASIPGSIKKFEKKDKEGSPYSLEELMEEQTVGSVSFGDPRIIPNQMEEYISRNLRFIKENELNPSDSFEEQKKILFHKFFEKFMNDIEQIQNIKHKNMSKKLFKYLRNYLLLLHKSFSYDEEMSNDYNLEVLISDFLSYSEKFINKFDYKNNSSSPNSPQAPIADLTDDFKMSLIRRWYLAVDQEVDNILEQSRQLSFEF